MTTPPRADAADAWRTLELGQGTSEFSLATVRLALDAGYGPVRVALGPSGDFQLLIPTQTGRKLSDSISSEAVSVKTVQFLVSGRLQPFIEVSCGVSELAAPFRLLVDDVIGRLQQGTGPEQAVASAVAQFRDLLRRRSASIEELIGLFGELHLLNELLALNPEAAKAWTGPLPQRHDFSSSQICAEVKSTLKREGRSVHISSLEQLQAPPDGRPLILVHTVLERTGTAGFSVRDLIEKAMQRSVDPSVLDHALKSLRLDDWRSNDSLAAERFALLHVDCFRVENGFPKLEPGSFIEGLPPPGVFGVRYSLDLHHAGQWKVASEGVPRLFERLAGVP